MRRAVFALLLVFLPTAASAQLYVTTEWTSTTEQSIGSISHAEYRDYWFGIDRGQFVSLRNDISGPRSSFASGSDYGEIDVNNGMLETQAYMGVYLPVGCYRSMASASAVRNDVREEQTAATGQYCIEPPEDPKGDEEDQDCGWACSPLVLDLNGDGIHTTGEESTVWFDMDADGDAERLGWTNPATAEAFLWIDLIPNHFVDDGRELFGVGTILPTGERAGDGFEALAAYDVRWAGGNEDGFISVADAVWSRLRLWIDTNHDGVSQPTEVQPLQAHQIVALRLAPVRIAQVDAEGNIHALRSVYSMRERNEIVAGLIDDVFFRVYD